MNYHKKRFRVIMNSKSGEVSDALIFTYKQEGKILSAEYSGGMIIKGFILGIVDDKGNIDMRYQQINNKGELRTGKCHSTPEIMANGKIRLYETWQWTTGDQQKGESVLEEL